MQKSEHSFKSPYSAVSAGSLQYCPSERIIQLSKAKVKKDNHVRKGKNREEAERERERDI
jgi:hypothetical protein